MKKLSLMILGVAFTAAAVAQSPEGTTPVTYTNNTQTYSYVNKDRKNTAAIKANNTSWHRKHKARRRSASKADNKPATPQDVVGPIGWA